MRTCSPRRRSYINHSIAMNSPQDDGARCLATTLRYDTKIMNGRRSKPPAIAGLPGQPGGQHAEEQPRGSAAGRLATMVGLPVSSSSSAFSGQATLRPSVVDSSCRVRSHCSQIRSGRRPRSAVSPSARGVSLRRHPTELRWAYGMGNRRCERIGNTMRTHWERIAQA